MIRNVNGLPVNGNSAFNTARLVPSNLSTLRGLKTESSESKNLEKISSNKGMSSLSNKNFKRNSTRAKSGLNTARNRGNSGLLFRYP